jgi:hypothetical protein
MIAAYAVGTRVSNTCDISSGRLYLIEFNFMDHEVFLITLSSCDNVAIRIDDTASAELGQVSKRPPKNEPLAIRARDGGPGCKEFESLERSPSK